MHSKEQIGQQACLSNRCLCTCHCTHLQAEPDILVTTGSDRSIALYDLRSGAQKTPENAISDCALHTRIAKHLSRSKRPVC